jgi:hypothetical protein
MVFETDADFQKYLSNLRRFVPECDCKILAYCLLPERLDLLVSQSKPRAITTLMRKLTTAYSMFKKKSPFSGVYKAKLLVGDRQALEASCEIHRLPMSQSVTRIGPLELRSTFIYYQYSSYHLYVDSISNSWIDTLCISRLVPDYKSFVE